MNERVSERTAAKIRGNSEAHKAGLPEHIPFPWLKGYKWI